MSWRTKGLSYCVVLLSGASLHAASPPSIAKAFAPASVNVGTPATLTFTITNPNSGTTLTGVGFTDVLPPGLVAGNASVPVCGGTLTVTLPNPVTATSSSTVTLAGASIANPGPPCQFPIAVIGAGAGTKNNVTGAVTSNEGGTGNTASATLQVLGPPILSKSFTPAQILVNQTSTLAFSISNPNASLTLTGIGFSDNLPANVLIANPSGLSGSCGGGTISAPAGGSTITLTGAALAGGASCNFSLKVTSSVASIYPNITTQVTSAEEGLGAPVVAVLTVVGPPSIKKAFGKSLIPLGQATTLALTVINPNPTVTLTGVGFTDVLPAGLIAPTTSIAVCGGTLTIATSASNISTITLAGATLTPPAASVCPLTLAVIGVTPGVVVNTTSVVTSNEAGSGPPATATATVVAPPVINKSFSQLAIPVGASATLTFTIQNPNVPVSLTGVGFTDTLPSGLLVSTPNGLTGSCGGGTITAAGGINTITLAGATLAPTSACTFSVNVTAVAEGIQKNVTSAVNSVEGGSGNTASASITTGSALQVRYAANLDAGDAVINLSNSGANGANFSGPGFGNSGNICVSVYAFSPDEQLASCCSCLITPNGLASLSVVNDLTSNTLTGVHPSSVVIKLLSSLAGGDGTGSSCIGSQAFPNVPAPGMLAWGTTLHPSASGTLSVVETPFSPSTLSQQELTSLTNRCTNIIGNGSSFGICRSCRGGGLGADKR